MNAPKLYRVHYRGAEEDGYEGSYRVRAFSTRHAEELHYEDPINDLEGWEFVRAERIEGKGATS